MHPFNPYTNEDLPATTQTLTTLTPALTSPYLTQTLNPNPNSNPYFVYESLICQRQAICVTEVKDGGDKASVSGERNLLQQTQ